MADYSHTLGFIQGGREIYIAALMDASDEEIMELLLEFLGIPEVVESVEDPERRERYEQRISLLLDAPRDVLAHLLAPLAALY